MSFLLTIALFILSCLTIDGNLMKEYLYEQQKYVDAYCYTNNACQSVYSNPSSLHTCNCDPECSLYGTCCKDSIYKRRALDEMTCTYIAGGLFFVVDRCPPHSTYEFKDLCNDSWNKHDDVTWEIPVTNLFTTITYKNYYCFMCHEQDDDYLYWNLKLTSFTEFNAENQMITPTVSYHPTLHSWVATFGENDVAIPVRLEVQRPSEVQRLKPCTTAITSSCDESWPDDEIREECRSYTAVTYVGRNKQYRNPYCALCNNESLSEMSCERPGGSGYGHEGPDEDEEFTPFSFTQLLDVNLAYGNRVGKIQRCTDGSVWNNRLKKCITKRCVLPTYIVKSGRCVPP